MAASELGDDCPTQDECIQLLSRLHGADVLHCNVPPDIVELTKRADTVRRRRFIASIRSPLAIRIPLFDPDKFLTKSLPFTQFLFSWGGAILWLIIVGYGLLLTVLHWSEFTENISDRVLAADNLFLLWLVFPIVKILHELGHGYAVKVRGGEVHEMGIMFLVLMPIPYVDASAASAFSKKWHRVVVGSAGILVEMPIAAIAMWLWVEAEPGLLRAVAYNVVLIAGISTLLFNGNPLLRFDGYYIFADLIEIPNLGPRGNKHIGFLIQKYLFGVKEPIASANNQSEARWMTFFAIASFMYRVFILVVIVSFIATKFFVVGIILAAWSVTLMFIWPLIKSLKFLFVSPRLEEKRMQALSLTSSILAGAIGLMFFLPLPYATITQGVVWAPDKSIVRTNTSGVIASVVVKPREEVVKGQILLIMQDPILKAEVRVLEATLTELNVRYGGLIVADQVKAQIIAEERKHVEKQLSFAKRRASDLELKSHASGKFLIRMNEDLPGRYFARGSLLGFIAGAENSNNQPTIRVAISQGDIDLIRNRTQKIEVRFSDDLDRVYPVQIRQISPSSTKKLYNLALSTEGGGWVSLDPRDPSSGKTVEELFHLELNLPQERTLSNIGGRVYVKFDHGNEPVGWQFYRLIRQVFLEKFNV